MKPLRAKATIFLATARRLSLNAGLVFNRKIIVVVTIGVLLICLALSWRIGNLANRSLEEQRARLELSNIVPFEKTSCPPLVSKDLAIWQGFRNSRAIARFGENYFVATDGGLVEFDTAGNLLRHYTVLDGLPESDLLSLAPLGGNLFIGTRTQGLVGFDGERFASYRFTDRTPQAISALLVDTNRLLIGTFAGGLIEFDGREFRELTALSGHRRLLGINHLSKQGSRLFVGTFADGVWEQEGARWLHYTVANGLLSNRIVGVVADGPKLFIASDYGLTVAPLAALVESNDQSSAISFRTVATLPSLSGMIALGSNILLCRDDGETFTLSTEDDAAHLQVSRVSWNRPGGMDGCRLSTFGGELWLLSSRGIHHAQNEALETSSKSRSLPLSSFSRTTGNELLTTNLISALTRDTLGRVWAGSFRNGIDVFAPNGKKLSHLESDEAREINSLVEDRSSKTMMVATSQGLLRLNADLKPVDRLSTNEGLLSNSVLQVGLTKTEGQVETLACATSKGLSLGVPGKLRGLTTVQGLPSNSLYALLIQGRSIYAGTLNGLALIEDGRVVRVFKDTNSNLQTNWVTALCLVGSRLFVGTYGGGIFELTAAGELHSFASQTNRSVINPNAMWTDGARLFAGTPDGALIFDLESQRWTRVTQELPARTVLSITGDEEYIYFGTTSGIARIARAYWNQQA